VLHGKQWSGHIHLINGLYDANKAGNPVIAIASTIHTQNGTRQLSETRPESLFQDCSKYVFQASTQTSHQWFANRYSARHKHEGVAVLGLQEMASAELESVPTANHNFYTQPRITPNETHLLIGKRYQ
jgi:pyruvate dehydrogenase (quinone)